MFNRIISFFRSWVEHCRNLRRYRKGRRDYEAALGANLRYVENYLKNR